MILSATVEHIQGGRPPSFIHSFISSCATTIMIFITTKVLMIQINEYIHWCNTLSESNGEVFLDAHDVLRSTMSFLYRKGH